MYCSLSNRVIVILSLLVCLVYLLVSRPSEKFTDLGLQSYAYQNNIQPFYLSPESVNLWMKPSYELCKPRAQAACSAANSIDRPGCVLQSLRNCQVANTSKISDMCKASIPQTLCKKQCQSNPNQLLCKECQAVALMYDVCKQPAILPL